MRHYKYKGKILSETEVNDIIAKFIAKSILGIVGISAIIFSTAKFIRRNK